MGNTTTIGMTKNKQFIMTLPKAIAELMRAKKGDRLEFIMVGGELVVRKI